MAVDIPHLRWPFRLTTGADLPGQVPHAPLQLVEQDTIDDVRQSVHLLLKTPPGARPLAPAIGFADPTFTSGVDGQLLAALLEEAEDRALVTVEVDTTSDTGREMVRVRVVLADSVGSEEEAV